MQEARAQLALLQFARLIVSQLGSISSLRLIPTIHSFHLYVYNAIPMGVLANPDLNQAMAPSKQKRTHAVLRASSAHQSASTSKPRFVGEKVKLGDLCDINSGGTPKRSVSEYWNEGSIPWVKISDISSKFVSSTEEQITEAGLEGSSAKLLAPGTLLYSIFASIGAVGILKIPAATNQAIAGLSIKTDRIERDYLYHYLKSQEALAKSSGRGVAQNNINLTILRGMEVPVPVIDEQRIIVEQLEMVAAQIKQAETQLAKLDSLVKSRFVEMFGDTYLNSMAWDSCKLGELISFMTSGSRGWARYYSDDGEYFLTIKNVKKCKVDVTGVQHVIAPVGKESVRTKVQENDVLISITADLGRTGVVTKEIAGHGAYINQHLACIRLTDDSVDPVFLSHFLESPGGIDQFAKKNQNGVKAGLNFNLIRSLEIQMPPLTLQQEFATFVSQVDKSRFIAQQQIEKLQMLYDSLAQDYFGD